MSYKLEDLAESVYLRLVNRIASPIIVSLLIWAGVSLETMKTDMSVALFQLNQHETRIASIEGRFIGPHAGVRFTGE